MTSGALTADGRRRRLRQIVAGLIAAGIVIKVLTAFTTSGEPYDIGSLEIARRTLANHPLEIYATGRWPYPPGYFPIIAGGGGIASFLGVAFGHLIRIVPIAADACIALLVRSHLARRGASATAQIVAVAAVAFGPIFWEVAAYHGQIDSFAFLPAVAAVWLWERGTARRGLYAGLLIGAGAAIKTVPFVVLLAMLPTARSRREAITVAVGAVAVPLIALLPWLVHEYHAATTLITKYRGIPGAGGLSLFVQPRLAENWLGAAAVAPSAASRWLADHTTLFSVLTILTLAALMALFARRRVPAPPAAATLLLALLVVNPNVLHQYYLWPIPFALMAGWIWSAVAFELVATVPAVMAQYALQHGAGTPTSDTPFGKGVALGVYVPLSILIWLTMVVAVGAVAARLIRHRGVEGRPLNAPD